MVIPTADESSSSALEAQPSPRRPAASVVELEGISVSYGTFQALNEISLQLPLGATGLVGRNGAGKSTLLRLLLGLIRPTNGSGTVLGVPLQRSGRELRRAVGYMPENDAFLPGMKAIEQVALAGELCSLSRREAIRRAHEVLSYTGLGEARYRPVEGFSTGMKQRLKLAVALVHDPALLLLDEPTVGLDPPGRQRMLDLIADLVRKHDKSLVISTHLLADIQYTCDYVVMIDKGRVMISGRLEEVMGTGTSRYRIQWEGNGTAFLEAIQHLGGKVTVRGDVMQGALPMIEAEATVEMPADFEPATFFQLAHEGNVRLRFLDREFEELSELYHRLLDREAAHVG